METIDLATPQLNQTMPAYLKAGFDAIQTMLSGEVDPAQFRANFSLLTEGFESGSGWQTGAAAPPPAAQPGMLEFAYNETILQVDPYCRKLAVLAKQHERIVAGNPDDALMTPINEQSTLASGPEEPAGTETITPQGLLQRLKDLRERFPQKAAARVALDLGAAACTAASVLFIKNGMPGLHESSASPLSQILQNMSINPLRQGFSSNEVLSGVSALIGLESLLLLAPHVRRQRTQHRAEHVLRPPVVPNEEVTLPYAPGPEQAQTTLQNRVIKVVGATAVTAGLTAITIVAGEGLKDHNTVMTAVGAAVDATAALALSGKKAVSVVSKVAEVIPRWRRRKEDQAAKRVPLATFFS
jgi:hypothetical protein